MTKKVFFTFGLLAVGLLAGLHAHAATVVPRAPAKPTFTAIQPRNVTVKWGAISGAQYYTLERTTALDPDNFQFITSQAGTTYTDTDLEPSTIYFYRLFASNEIGDGPYSSSSVVQTAPLVFPLKPGTPTYTGVTSSSVVVRWTTGSGANAYKLERADEYYPDYFIEVASTTALTFTDRGLSPSTGYFYRVKGVNVSGEGPFSNTSTIRTPPYEPPAPGKITFSNITTSSVLVKWGVASGATGYELETSDSANTASFSLLAATSGLSYFDTDIESSTVYFYRVRAYNDVGYGPYSAIASTTTAAPILPVAPAKPTFANIGPSSVSVRWNGVANATHYGLERATSSLIGPYLHVATTTASTSNTYAYTDSGLSGNTTYFYRVRARNDIGMSGPSGTSSVTTLTPDYPGVPGAIQFSNVTANTVTLSWGVARSAQQYKIERALGDSFGVFSQIAIVSSTVYNDFGLVPGNRYTYRIRATNPSGDGPYTNHATYDAPSGESYARTSSYISPVMTLASGKTNVKSVVWEGALPPGTRVKMQFAASNLPAGGTIYTAYNPATRQCESGYAQTLTAPGTPTILNTTCFKDKPYVRVKLILESDNSYITPRVDRMVFLYR